MIHNEIQIINIFCEIDDFCKKFLPYWKKHLISNKKRNRESVLSISEIMTIMVLYQSSKYKDFKTFYETIINYFLKKYFKKTLSYNRFLTIEKKALIPLLAFLQYKKGKKTGIYYVDSTPLSVCKNQRIKRHKTFKGVAERGKSSMGWFYGFKLHLIINSQGEIISFKITKGNVNDIKPVKDMAKGLSGKMFGDRGYISQELKEKLKKEKLDFITKIRQNMKKKAKYKISNHDKFLLSKRGIVETVIGQIKDMTNICTTKIKNKFNYFVNLFSALVFYTMKRRKPRLNIGVIEKA